MKTLEQRIADLEKQMANLQEILATVLAPLPLSLEDQHRLKLAARAKGK